MSVPTEAKVKAATGGATIGAAVAALACWIIDTQIHTPAVAGDLPEAVSGVVVAAVAAGAAYASGWLARHTPREPR